MATTTLIPLHAGGRSIAEALGRTTSYVENFGKTDGGEWITSYECDPLTVTEEFLFSKRQYTAITGRDQGDKNVIAYHLRQSFKPGEIDPATANRIGYELAMKLTKGRHAFVCCTHTDKLHIHSHIVINSTSLDCTRKFRNFYRSSFAIRRISDLLCLENGLSVVENPKPSPGKDYGDWLGDKKPQTNRHRLEDLIDSVLPACKDFDGFLAALQEAGCEIKRGKYLSIKIPGAERFARCKSLGADYTEDAIRERISGKRTVASRQKTAAPVRSPDAPNLLIDIQAKIQQGYGAGFEHFAKIHNIKAMSKTLIFIQENGITDYNALVKKDRAASAEFHRLSDRLKVIEKRMDEIRALQKQMNNYRRMLEAYRAYRDSKWSPKFYNEHESDIIIHKAAKKYFDDLGVKKLPPMQELNQEWATLDAERKKLYAGYREAKQNMIDWQKAKYNADVILGEPRRPVRSHTLDAR